AIFSHLLIHIHLFESGIGLYQFRFFAVFLVLFSL
ncbi:hypothetical protein NT04LM_2796, partial [Listeria monocytogenes FSL F2-208]